MNNDLNPSTKILKFSRRSTILISSIWAGILLAALILFIVQRSEDSVIQAPISIDQMIDDKKTQISGGISSTFKAWAGRETFPSTTDVELRFSDDKKYLTVNYEMNVLDYTSIALHQEYLTGHSFDGKFGRPFGNPYCNNYDDELIYVFLNRLSWEDLERPTAGIFININRFETEKVTDKYGNSKNKVNKLKPVKFGISIADFNKINWGGDGINLRQLSTLIPYSNPDVSWCNSDLDYGALLNLD